MTEGRFKMSLSSESSLLMEVRNSGSLGCCMSPLEVAAWTEAGISRSRFSFTFDLILARTKSRCDIFRGPGNASKPDVVGRTLEVVGRVPEVVISAAEIVPSRPDMPGASG